MRSKKIFCFSGQKPFFTASNRAVSIKSTRKSLNFSKRQFSVQFPHVVQAYITFAKFAFHLSSPLMMP
ncbi:MAG: hypothetical protein ACFFBY_04975 [Promethearchaeota archaeon]